jgi:hypothetical protein
MFLSVATAVTGPARDRLALPQFYGIISGRIF